MTTPVTFVYVTKDGDTETTIHLSKQDDIAWGDLGKTLCGRTLEGLTFGDETQSGLVATCKTCHRIAHNINWPKEAAK